VTSSSGYGGIRKLAWAFTEHGALMAANVLNGSRAIEMSVFVVRAFVELRNQYHVRDALAKHLDQIERKLLRHDTTLQEVYREIKALRRDAESAGKCAIGFRPDD